MAKRYMDSRSGRVVELLWTATHSETLAQLHIVEGENARGNPEHIAIPSGIFAGFFEPYPIEAPVRNEEQS